MDQAGSRVRQAERWKASVSDPLRGGLGPGFWVLLGLIRQAVNSKLNYVHLFTCFFCIIYIYIAITFLNLCLASLVFLGIVIVGETNNLLLVNVLLDYLILDCDLNLFCISLCDCEANINFKEALYYYSIYFYLYCQSIYVTLSILFYIYTSTYTIYSIQLYCLYTTLKYFIKHDLGFSKPLALTGRITFKSNKIS